MAFTYFYFCYLSAVSLLKADVIGFIMSFFRRIKLKRMKKKAAMEKMLADKVEELAKDAWRKTEELDSEYKNIYWEIYRIPWYRPFKRRSMKRNLQNLVYEYYKTQEEAAEMDKVTQQIREKSNTMYNLAEAEKISQQLSDKPDDINTIRQWLLNPPNRDKASSLKENKKKIPKTKGIYAWYFKHDSLPVPSNSYFKVDDFELLYVGIAGKSPESKGDLRDRIYNKHINGNAEGSTLRFSLGVLLRRKGSPLELKRKGIIKKRIKWSNEDYITEWICDNALVAWIEHKRPWKVEESAVKNLGHLLPLNIKHNKENLFAQELNRERESLKNKI